MLIAVQANSHVYHVCLWLCLWWQDLSPGSIEEAEEAEPDDEFKDAIEVNLKS